VNVCPKSLTLSNMAVSPREFCNQRYCGVEKSADRVGRSFFRTGSRFGSDAAAAWGNGKAAHGDPNAQILFFGSTKGASAGFGLDGATIKWDESGDKALYGKPITNTVIVNGGTPTPKIAEAFVSKLGQGSNR
jgi:lipid-binding SYLF domain-containing protein